MLRLPCEDSTGLSMENPWCRFLSLLSCHYCQIGISVITKNLLKLHGHLHVSNSNPTLTDLPGQVKQTEITQGDLEFLLILLAKGHRDPFPAQEATTLE